MTVQNLEEKAELNETVERLKAQFAAVSNNLEVQTADNAQLSRYAATTCILAAYVSLLLPSLPVLSHTYRSVYHFPGKPGFAGCVLIVFSSCVYMNKFKCCDNIPASGALIIIIIIIITRLMTHVEVIHRVKNRKCGWSRISEGKLGCEVQSLPIV